MTTDCANCPLRRHDLFKTFSEQDLKSIQKFKVGEIKVDPGTPLLMEGSNSPQLFTALRGMGLRYKTLANGRRQVLNFVFPGDFLGLQSGLMDEMGHSIEATSHMTLCVFNRSELWTFFPQPSRPRIRYHLACRGRGAFSGRGRSHSRTAHGLRGDFLGARADIPARRGLGTGDAQQHVAALSPAVPCGCVRTVLGAHQQDAEQAA